MIDKNLKILLKELKLTQKYFAKEVGLHFNTIGKYVRGERYPDSKFINKLTDLYNVNPHWLVTGHGEMLLPKAAVNNPKENYFVEKRYDYQQPCMQKIIELSKKLNHPQRNKLINFITNQYDIEDFEDVECDGENNKVKIIK